MKKKNIINLIHYYSEKNYPAFHEETYEIARDFDASRDFKHSEYIMALMSSANAFVPHRQSSKASTILMSKSPSSLRQIFSSVLTRRSPAV